MSKPYFYGIVPHTVPQLNERSLPIYCPTCGHPVSLILDLGVPVQSPQNWNCPRCGALHLASFEARVKTVTPRMPIQK